MTTRTHLAKQEEAQTETGVQYRAADPVSPVTGQVWINTTTKLIKYYNGATVVVITEDDLAAKVAKSTATTKGDIFVATASATIARQGVGSNNLPIIADSAQTNGIKYAKLPEAGGGTNQTAYTAGDTLYASATDTLSKLAVGTANQVIKSVNGLPAWAAAPSGGVNYLNANPEAEVATTGWTTYSDTDSVTFTDAGDIVTLNSHGLSNGQTVSFTSITSTTGISTNTLYYVVGVTTNTFQLATSIGGSALALTTNGSGTMGRGYPDNGTGGSPTWTWTRSTSSPLRGSASFLATKDAANRMGEGVAYDFTLDAADKAKPICISFDYTVGSGTYADGDLQVYLIADPGSTKVLIQPAPYRILNVTAGVSQKWIGEFQTDSTNTSYRLVIHATSVSASAYTVKFDNFNVGPTYQSYGAVMTDWQQYTPTFGSGWGTNTGVSFWWRQVGANIQVKGNATSGTVGAGSLSFTLPSGKTANTSVVNTSGQAVGMSSIARASTTGAANFALVSIIGGDGTTCALTNMGNGSNTRNFAVLDGSTFMASTTAWSAYVELPISGWSSNVQVSSDASTRVVAARYHKASTTANATGATNIIDFETKDFDTHGAVTTGASWKYTAPVPGKYRVNALSLDDGANTWAVNKVQDLLLYKNGSSYSTLYRWTSEQAGTTSQPVCSGGDVVDMVAGDYLDLRTFQNSGGSRTLTSAIYVVIERISGPAQIAASETVAARYTNTAGSTLTKSATNTVPFATKDYDTHSTFVTDTFTAPSAGKYGVVANANIATGSTWASGDFILIAVYKNGALHTAGNNVLFFGTFVGAIGAQVSAVVNCVQGDTITINVNPTKAAASNVTLNTTAGYNSVSIVRLGNG